MANFVLSDNLELLGTVTGSVRATIGSGYALLNEAATDDNPTLIPRRADLTTGIGGQDNEGSASLTLVIEGSKKLDVLPNAMIWQGLANGARFNMRVFVDGVGDTVQLQVQGHSTQVNNIVTIEQSDQTPLFTINNAGTVTVGFGLTVPADALVIDIETPSGNGTFRDSHTFVMRGKARQAGGTPRPSEWRQLVDATNADGESSFLFQAVNPFSQNVAEILRLGNGGNITIPQGSLTLSSTTGDIVFTNVEQQILWQGCSTYFIANLDTPDELFFGNNTVSVGNAVFSLENAQVFKFRLGAQNAQSMNVRVASALVATPSGATATATNLIPAGSFVVGITTRVTTLVTGPAGYDVGDGVDVDLWGNSIAVALNTTSDIRDFTSGALINYPAAQDVVITSDGVDFTGGAVRITVHYMTLTAPSS